MKTFSAVAGLTLFFCSAPAVEIPELIKETQKFNQIDGKMIMAWWIPNQFWEENLKQDPTITTAEREEISGFLDDYTVFATMNVDVSGSAGLNAKSEEEIRQNTTLTVDGENIEPVEFEELNSDAKMFFNLMKPMMESMLGEFGQGLVFIPYPNLKDGQPILDATRKQKISYRIFSETFSWRLPLGSLLPPKYDPASGEKFPGNYLFNPFTGLPLQTLEP